MIARGGGGSSASSALTPTQARIDEETFASVFDAYFADIHGYAAGRVGTDLADDIAAATFEVAFRKRRQYNPECGNVRSWLYGIATRHLRRHRRQETRRYLALRRLGQGAPPDDHEDEVVERVSAQQSRRRLAAALAGLSAADRDVLLLVALGGLTHAEVSFALDIPYGTVGSRLNRARRKLRQELAGLAPGDGTRTVNRDEGERLDGDEGERLDG